MGCQLREFRNRNHCSGSSRDRFQTLKHQSIRKTAFCLEANEWNAEFSLIPVFSDSVCQKQYQIPPTENSRLNSTVSEVSRRPEYKYPS
jgi:hypothetical protein